MTSQPDLSEVAPHRPADRSWLGPFGVSAVLHVVLLAWAFAAPVRPSSGRSQLIEDLLGRDVVVAIDEVEPRFALAIDAPPVPAAQAPPVEPEKQLTETLEVAEPETERPSDLAEQPTTISAPEPELLPERASVAAAADSGGSEPAAAGMAPAIGAAGDAPAVGAVAAPSTSGENGTAGASSGADGRGGAAAADDVAVGDEAARARARSRYLAAVRQRLALLADAPRGVLGEADHDGPFHVTVVAIVDDRGRILEVFIEQSSGVAAIDAYAVRSVRQLRRFVSVPAELGDEGRRVSIPLVYEV